MKKKMNINKYFLIMCLIMIPVSCGGKNIDMTDKELLLKERVQKFCNLIEEGNFKQTRKYYIPRWQNLPEQEYKGDFSGLAETEINKDIIKYYRIKTIQFRDEIAEVMISSSMLNKKHTTYDYWIFIKDNWYIVDGGRSNAASSLEIEKYKKLVQDNPK